MVSVYSSYTVIPSEPTTTGKLPSSLCEQIKLRTHAPILYVYKPNSNHLASSQFAIDSLRSSLSKALVPYYPLAGRLCWIEGARWELHCNAKGAKLLEANCELNLDDLGDFVPTQIVEKLIPNIDYGCPIEEVPLLAVQLTRFPCGGITIGVAFCRAVIDGPASMSFMNSWAKLARGSDLDSTDQMPFHDRTVLNSHRLHMAPRFDHSEFYPPPLWVGGSLEDARAVVSNFKLTKDQVQKLKKKVSAFDNRDTTAAPQQRPYTSFEIIAGHLWRCVSKARYAAGNGHQPTRLSTLANCRNRLRPPLPSNYAGNAAFPTVTSTCSFDELVHKPVSYAVGSIRQALERLTDEYVSSALDYIANQKDMNLVRYNFHYPAKSVAEGQFRGNPNLFVVSWMNFSFRETDFGWGRAEYFGPGYMDSEGKAFVMNNADGNGLIVAICLQAQHMDAFKKFFYQDIEELFPTSKL